MQIIKCKITIAEILDIMNKINIDMQIGQFIYNFKMNLQ